MWAQVVSTAVGVWLIAAPQLLNYHSPGRTNDHIVGPLVATFGCIAIWEATRPVRWANFVLGIWLVLAPWVLQFEWGVTAHSTVAGLTIAGLALIRGQLRHRLGGGWQALWRKDTNGLSPVLLEPAGKGGAL